MCTALALASMLFLPVWQVVKGRRMTFWKGGHWCSSLEKLELVCIAVLRHEHVLCNNLNNKVPINDCTTIA